MDGWCFLSEISRFSIRTTYNHPMDPVILDMFQTIGFEQNNHPKNLGTSAPKKIGQQKQNQPQILDPYLNSSQR